MKITQINGARGLILKSSIKKIIIDSDIENASAFKDIVITHLSLDTLNIIENNSNQYRRINLSYDLMLLLQKLWRYNIIKKPNVMPKFRILPSRYEATLGLEFKITAYDSDDGLPGSIAIIIEDMSTGEKLGYVPNFITQGQHKNRIKKWKRAFRDAHLTQFTSFNSNINKNTNLTNVSYSEKEFKARVTELLPETEKLKLFFSPFNPERLLEINKIATQNNYQIIWQPTTANLLHYYFPNDDFYTTSDNSLEKDHLINVNKQELNENNLIQEQPNNLIAQDLRNYLKIFRNTLPQSDFLDIIKMIHAQETYMI